MVVIEVASAPLPDQVPEAAPVRFALQEDGTLYVGGSHYLEVGVLDSSDMKEIEKRVSAVRKLDLAGTLSLGPGPQ